MDKLKMKSNNLVDANVEKIASLFPNCVTESVKEYDENGKPVLHKVVDFDLLKQELSNVLVEGRDERYRLDWAGKRQAILTANSPIAKTLRPSREDSINFDTTENLYIEGDNLDVLKLLHETYLNKIKMIYIDPPYNTGKDFVYNDDFAEDTEEYLYNSNQKDEQGNRMTTNKETSGRYHSDWLSMMYMRLKLAKDLLTDDGIIFISIDDNEQTNIKKVCDELFGQDNFIANIIVEGTPKNDPLIVSTAHEYCLVYVRNYQEAKQKSWGVNNPIYSELVEIFETHKPNYKKVEEELLKFYKNNNLQDDNISNYKFSDEQGIFRTGPIDDPQSGGARDTRYNPKTGLAVATPNRGWSCNRQTWDEWIIKNLIYFPDDHTKLCSKKTYIEADRLDLLRSHYKTQIRKDTKMLEKMFDDKRVFSFPKPVDLIKTFIDGATADGDIVMDFFSGSATTAHAVMLLSNHKNLKFIMVQLPENLEENLKSAKGNEEKQICQNAIDFCEKYNKPKILTEIGKERIKKSAKAILDELPPILQQQVDFGFRVLKLADSNMKDVYYNPKEYNQSMLLGLDSSIKEDRTAEDLLFQVMLDKGVLLSSKIEKKTTTNGEQSYYIVGDTGFDIIDLICCLDKKVNTEAVKEIAKLQSECCVFLDSGIEDDATRTNIQQIFTTYSPKTKVEVI